MTLAFALIRALHFASLMTLFGACTFGWIARTRLRCDIALPRVFLPACGGIALATALVSVGFVAGEMTGSEAALFAPAPLGQVLFHSLYGHIALERIVLLAVFLVIAWAVPSWQQFTGAVSGGVALALLGMTSHAAAAGLAQFEYLRAIIDALHLLAAGFWVGSLAVLAFVVVREPRETAKQISLLRLLSRWGAFAVAILVVSGTINGIAILDMQGMRWSPAYLTWLAVKLVLAGLMIALALTNRFGVVPGLVRGDKEAAETLPLTLFAELGSAALILIAVGFLGLTAPMQM
ncbi:MAG: CopD family protein [Rhizomicrobium sp.]